MCLMKAVLLCVLACVLRFHVFDSSSMAVCLYMLRLFVFYSSSMGVCLCAVGNLSAA